MAEARVFSPTVADVAMTPQQEQNYAIKLHNEIESLAALSKQVSELRQVVALESRRNDLDHIRKIDVIATNLLDTVIQNADAIQQALDKTLRNGNVRALKDVSQAVQMLMEVREQLLGFDETRQLPGKRKMRLQVVWKGTDGTSGGVNIEA